MTQEQIFYKIQDIFIETSGKENLRINPETKMSDLEEWDSLFQVVLISALEKNFNITFALGEQADLTSISNIVSIVTKKIKS